MTTPRRSVSGALLSGALAVALVGCRSPQTTPSVLPVTNAVSAPALPTSVDALPSMDAAGLQTLLGQLRGTPVVVNFWASWCDPCTREAVVLNAVHASDGDAVQFLGVDTQDSREGAIRFLAEHQVRYPSVFDPANAIGLPLGLFAPPMTIVYDANGDVAAMLRGEVSSEDLRAAVAKVSV